jgi:hypothetical protein
MTVAPADQLHTRRAAVVGGSIGFTVVTLAVWLLAATNGVEAIPALGLALFVAIWGGLGFGAMLAASVWTARR